MRVVISQSMFFPWVGLLDQMRLADVFVHYDDVQFSKGSFTNRVQLKTENGIKWLTVPLSNFKFGQLIKDVRINTISEWRERHLSLIENQLLRHVPFSEDVHSIIDNIYNRDWSRISDLARSTMMAMADYFGFLDNTKFLDSEDIGIKGRGSERVLEIVKALGGDEYITGHGARNYLDHEAFEREGIRVSYMRYDYAPWPQLHGPFTPYVTALDLVANCGKEGIRYINSGTVDWKEFVHGYR